MALIKQAGFLLAIVAAFTTSASAQYSEMPIQAGGPFSRDAVLNAPFLADATTTIRKQLPDGSTRDYQVTSRY